MVFKTGLWSIKANGMEHDLVAQYMAEALEKEKLDDTTRTYVAIILSKKWPDSFKIKVTK